MKKKLLLIFGLVIILIIIRMVISGLDQNKNSGKKSNIPAVTAYTVKSENVRQSFETTARVNSKYRVDVLARISGYLIKSYFKEGDYVKAGQILFEIEPQEYIYAADRAKANLGNIQSQADYYEKQLARYAELVAHDYVAKSEYDKILAEKNAYFAQVESAKSAYRDAQRNLGYTRIKAPVDGRVGIIDVTVGNYVNSSAKPLTTINSSNPMYVTFPLESEKFSELVKVDGNVNVDREVEFIFSSGEKYKFKGVQDFYDNKIDESTGMITLRATFQNADDRLIQGEFGRAIIYSKNKKEMPVIPQSATMENQEGLFVYILDDKDVARISYIKTIGTSETNWIVSQGVNIGDKIIATGVQKVVPGSRVRVVEAIQDTAEEKTNENNIIKFFKKIFRRFRVGKS